MLEIKDLTLCYPSHPGVPVVERLDFTLEAGKILAIAGPSGCGKTTLIRALAGVLPPASGAMTYGGRPLTPLTCSIGLLPQNYGLLPWKTVRENCLLCAGIKEKRSGRKQPDSAAGRLDALDALARELGISALLSRYPSTLSGGQAQRAALARAFLMDPQLLLMDEPFAALDIAAAASARRLCLKLCKKSGCCAIIVTHRLEDAFYLADQIAVMQKGCAGRFSYLADNAWQGMEAVEDPHYARACAALSAQILASAGGKEKTV